MMSTGVEQQFEWVEMLLIIRQFVADLEGIDGLIADRVLCGQDYRTIGRELGMSPGTVHKHLRGLAPRLRARIEDLPFTQQLSLPIPQEA